MSANVREATLQDVPKLLAIERQCFSKANWRAEDFLRYNCSVAELEGQIAGFVVGRETCPCRDRLPAEREILTLAVSPVFRRFGVATSLLHYLLREPANYFLEVRESNITARALYEKLHFREIGRRINYYREPAETAIVMQMKKC